MQYIIYSNGAKGYGFYKSSDNFSEDYKNAIEDLYTKDGIADTDTDAESRGVRFAPLKEKYLVSVIYRNCTGNNESRRMIAGVNFLLEYEELEQFIASGQEFLMDLLQKSDMILEREGYKFNLEEYSSESKQVLSEQCKCALSAAAYSAMDYAYTGNVNHNYSLQAFVGYKTLYQAYGMVLWMFNSVPVVFWKQLSAYMGAAKASETMDVTLALMEEKTLEHIDKRDEYSGTMPTPKVVQYGDSLSGKPYIPAEVNKYLVLSKNDLSLIEKVFQYTDDTSVFWKLVTKLADDIKSANTTKICVDVLGEQLTMECIEKKIISEDAVVLEVYKNRNSFKGYNNLLALVDNRIQQQKKAESKQKEKTAKEKNSKKSKGKKNTESVSAEKTVDKSEAQKDENKKDNVFGFVRVLTKNRFLLCLTIAVLSLLVIVFVNAFALEISLKLFSEGLKFALLKTVPFSKYILTIVGLNIVNIPVGFTLVASVIELLKMHSDNKRGDE